MSRLENISFRTPCLEDGLAVHRLIESCPPLDTNSSYCNFLQCSHFANTSVIAEAGKDPVGFISGYILPERNDTLFIWQVAVAERARGFGLASRMLNHIISRPQCKFVSYLETTITKSNQASWALFRRAAQKLSSNLNSSVWIDGQLHFDGLHDSEHLVRIGPFTQVTNFQ
ncbi:diaminobutyrate acetyltransferase [uncultured Microbulbifer sp.]|uniref:diaminobutyrate acetyltransferase n=1 Tax=uncultured Microbulbifer sp. TaxID=348147 RepID=UPI00261AEEF2|nr:diaminobutyrate acetyltransferase [uncultured Microbulbifer sp.]